MACLQPLSSSRSTPLGCSSHRKRLSPARSSLLPFPAESAAYHRELAAGVRAVERACRLCVDVKQSLLSCDRRIIEKNDQTPVTIADFGVQALISWELKKYFPSIPLVAEEDSTFLRSFSNDHSEGTSLVDAVVDVVAENLDRRDFLLTHEDVLGAIDRGGKNATFFDAKPATYWILDPIDGTKGFLKGTDALYVVGLSLVVNGEIVAGVMGCPNWKNDLLSDNQDCKNIDSVGQGTIMIAHAGCGTWSRCIFQDFGYITDGKCLWKKCFVDNCSNVHEATFCIPDSQTWDMIPLSTLFCFSSEDTHPQDDKQIYLLPGCCGSLAKYLTVASGSASVFIMRKRTQTIIKAWDHAAGFICVIEAGGVVSDWNGRPLDFAADHLERRSIFPTGGVLVTNGLLHDAIVEMIMSNSLT